VILVQVIFNVGEIDCREGLLVALERDKYKSLEEGMETVVNIFVLVLQELIKKRKFKVITAINNSLVVVTQ
jgi:hypothetical protein